jgi:hypothetical protein
MPIESPDRSAHQHSLDSSLRSRPRPPAFQLAVTREAGTVQPELFVDPGTRWAVAVGHLTVFLFSPVWLILQHRLRRRLGRSHPRFGGKSSLFWNTLGPAAFWQVAVERLGGTQQPSARDYTELLVPDQAMTDRLGGRRVIVADDFYDDPDAVREEALRQTMRRFDKSWYNTIHQCVPASRFTEEARVKLSELTGRELDRDAFYSHCGGDAQGWNCAYHAKLRENWLAPNSCDIHNHSNLGAEAWSGLVFLDRHGGSDTGTSFWLRRSTGSCAEDTWMYDARPGKFKLLTTVPAAYNRAVLFSAPLLHRGESGYGFDITTARLFQTFFFSGPLH